MRPSDAEVRYSTEVMFRHRIGSVEKPKSRLCPLGVWG
jgi:hypothetical protein